MVFCDPYKLENLIKETTCYKSPENPSRIETILANNLNSFQNSGVIGIGLSDVHKMTVTVMTSTILKTKNQISCSTETIENFLMIKFVNIFFPS